MGQETGPFFKKSKLQASHREELDPVESHTDVQSQLRTKGAVAHGQGWQTAAYRTSYSSGFCK